MFPYFALLFIPLIVYFVAQLKQNKLSDGKDNLVTNSQKVILPVFFLVLLLILVCRDETIGRDLPNYRYYFETFGSSDFFSIFEGFYQCIFYAYNWLVFNLISTNYQVYLAITAILILSPIVYIYLRERAYSYLQIVVFVNLSTFILMFSGIRQSLAIAVGMFAYDRLNKNNTMWYLVLVVIATLIHHSGFMLLFMYPLYKIHLHKRDLLWILPSVGFLFAFSSTIFSFLIPYMVSMVGDKYAGFAQETGAINMLILFVMFTIFTFVVADERKMDAETNVLRNFLLFAAMIQPLSSVHTLVMRVTYYYQIFIPIALAKSMKYASPKYRQIVKLANVVMCVFFTCYFVYHVYSTYVNYVPGLNDALGTIPYKFFWE